MILKDKLKRIWSYTYKGWAEKRIDEWIEMAESVDSPPVQNFAGRLDNYREGILNHCDHKVHTSKLEGINNKIKVLFRRSYGYRDMEYFELKVKKETDGY